MMTVELCNFSRTVLHIVFSVLGSTCAVGSSKITILLCWSSVRAKQINCRSPTLRFSPLSRRLKSNWPSKGSTKLLSFTSWRTCRAHTDDIFMTQGTCITRNATPTRACQPMRNKRRHTTAGTSKGAHRDGKIHLGACSILWASFDIKDVMLPSVVWRMVCWLIKGICKKIQAKKHCMLEGLSFKRNCAPRSLENETQKLPP